MREKDFKNYLQVERFLKGKPTKGLNLGELTVILGIGIETEKKPLVEMKILSKRINYDPKYVSELVYELAKRTPPLVKIRENPEYKRRPLTGLTNEGWNEYRKVITD